MKPMARIPYPHTRAYETSNIVRLSAASETQSHLTRFTVRAVLNETLRLFPPVPLNLRESRPEAVALPPSKLPSEAYVPTPKEPLYMPAGTPIMYMPMLMQRNPDLWGPDADAFDPDRWLDPARLSKVTGNPMMFMPFSAGPRIVRPNRNLRNNTRSI